MSKELQSIIFPKALWKTKQEVNEYLTKNKYPKKTIKTITEPSAFQYEIRPESNLVKGTFTKQKAGNVIFVFGRTPIPGHRQTKQNRHIPHTKKYSNEVELSPDVGSGAKQATLASIQSVMIPKTWGKQKAHKYLQKNDYSTSYYGKSPYTESKNFLRYRQEKPLKNGEFIQRKLNNGVNIVIQR